MALSASQLFGQVSLVKDINTTPVGLKPDNDYSLRFVQVGDLAFFRSDNNGIAPALWRTDGTTDGTYELDVNLVDVGVAAGKYLIYSKYAPNGDFELWRTDGTPAGTKLLKGGLSRALYPLSFGDRAAFAISAGNGAHSLWVTDGTVEGTKVAGQLTTTLTSSGIGIGKGQGDQFYFTISGSDGTQFVDEWWKLDASTGETKL
ncbi:MAG: hypothetical protein ACOYW3_04130, partial [Bacteroidota bacterium]